jgi:hypothetical protein
VKVFGLYICLFFVDYLKISFCFLNIILTCIFILFMMIFIYILHYFCILNIFLLLYKLIIFFFFKYFRLFLIVNIYNISFININILIMLRTTKKKKILIKLN